ncbi:MAG: single-stranded DNA-binding protein [Bacteroidia bacterium]|jgi:single-strand DNA-binding protein|nr:single-stranded DNA-binding protein [Bacteroidia bacterium]MCO5254021.1 single-stranded DNA-binding protein [Bacteroidota bacterium]MCZ2131556.1 single-stranded DNA-binding protein [Bacteroidia bacterium]
MSNLKNNVQLIGHLGANPEIKTLEGGSKVARLRVATSESFKNKNGEWQEETTWHSITAWGPLAERAEKHLSKGSYILLEGKLTSRNYVDSKGEKRYVYEVQASNFLLLDKKNPAAENMPAQSDSSAAQEDVLPF